MNIKAFDTNFAALTGHDPFPWQRKLYQRFTADRPDNIPQLADLPTGLGKTSVIAVWLLALLERPDVIPRRLVYVVNRRTVVDQTTTEVSTLRSRLRNPSQRAVKPEYVSTLERLGANLANHFGTASDPPLAVSTLRGQFADNQEWSADPSRPAVICGTVDMIGSRLLFEGYRVGFKRRPLHAGFLGQDALVVHDEAHLEPPFQQLIERIRKEQHEVERVGELPWPKLHVMALSATARSNLDDAGDAFGLTDEDLSHEIVARRLDAPKSLHLHQSEDEKKKLVPSLVEYSTTAERLRSDGAIIVFTRSVGNAHDVAKHLHKALRQAGLPRHVAILTGTMRGLERDRLVRDPVFVRFLPESDRPDGVTPARGTVFLVATSAGEVGVNLSADHGVSDLSTFDSMAQRLGRVNRFGDRNDTRIDVVYPASFDDKDPLSPARQATLELLRQLDGEATPRGLSKLPADRRRAAFAPEPNVLPATDILFDVWALTSIKGKLPGHPPVGPYLHGVADDRPQTTIAWRAELDLIDVESPDAEKALQWILTKHRIRPHETLTTNSYRVAEFLKQLKKRADLHGTRIAVLFSRELRLMTVGELIDDPGSLNAEPMLVFPAWFGGLDDRGMLSADSVQEVRPSRTASEVVVVDNHRKDRGEDADEPTLDVGDESGYEPYEDVPSRIRVLIERSEIGWTGRSMPGGKPLPNDWALEAVYESSTALLNRMRSRSGLNVRLVQAIDKNAEGEDIRSLVCLSPSPPSQSKKTDEPLTDHVESVEEEATRIADALGLPEPYRSALLFAARWHDEGKKAPVWQRYIGGSAGNGSVLGKSAKWRNPRILAGYRHEFGSLLRVENPCVLDTACTVPDDEDARELALHMIAAHHGYARPHFEDIVDHDFSSEQSEQTHLGVIRRYARLQRKYGRWGLAYLESLLRAADAAGSRAVGIDPTTDDDDTEEAVS